MKDTEELRQRNSKLVLRPYQEKDCEKLIDLFKNTVETVNSKDYNPDQISAWTSGVHKDRWNKSLMEHVSLVALMGENIVGFADLDQKKALLDRLYISASHQHEGIATVLCDALEGICAHPEIRTEASITARGFFEKRGYKVLREQQVERKGVLLTNYQMVKDLTLDENQK